MPYERGSLQFRRKLGSPSSGFAYPGVGQCRSDRKELAAAGRYPLDCSASSTKNGESERDPAMHQSKKGTGGRWRWSAISASIEILACCTLGNRRVSDMNVKINKIYEINFWAYFFLQKAISYNFYHAYVCHRIRRTH